MTLGILNSGSSVADFYDIREILLFFVAQKTTNQWHKGFPLSKIKELQIPFEILVEHDFSNLQANKPHIFPKVFTKVHQPQIYV